MDTPRDFDDNTWVAFSDLCGTKAMYWQRPERAADALREFYSVAYNLVHGKRQQVNGIAVTDCAIFWLTVSSGQDAVPPENLAVLLDLLKSLHEQLLGHGYLMRSTVAYGHFKYEKRKQLPQFSKNMAIGSAYLDAYATNDHQKPGAIVIVKTTGVPDPTIYAGKWSDYLKPVGNTGSSEFIWWAKTSDDTDAAWQRRNKAYEGRFSPLVKAYRT